MSQTLHIKVKQDHIEEGLADEPETCPIALALVEGCWWDDVSPRVQREFLGWNGEDGKRHYAYLPPEAIKFVNAFDEEMGDEGEGRIERFKPFEFDVTATYVGGAKEAGA